MDTRIDPVALSTQTCLALTAANRGLTRLARVCAPGQLLSDGLNAFFNWA